MPAFYAPSSKFIANFKALLSTTSVYLFQKDIAIHYFNLQNAAKAALSILSSVQTTKLGIFLRQ
jgi:hypothetical protein